MISLPISHKTNYPTVSLITTLSISSPPKTRQPNSQRPLKQPHPLLNILPLFPTPPHHQITNMHSSIPHPPKHLFPPHPRPTPRNPLRRPPLRRLLIQFLRSMYTQRPPRIHLPIRPHRITRLHIPPPIPQHLFHTRGVERKIRGVRSAEV